MCWSARELHSDRTQGNGLARSPGAMKVLQVITEGEVGGAQSHVLTLCRELRDRQGIEVQVAIGGDDGLQTPSGVRAERCGHSACIPFLHWATLQASLAWRKPYGACKPSCESSLQTLCTPTARWRVWRHDWREREPASR